MPAWIERIDRSASSSLLVEHLVRYRFALPAVLQAGLWADLGCGTGVAARAAGVTEFKGRALLVDNNESALAAVREELKSLDPRVLRADLAREEDLARVRQELGALGSADADTCITCFETFEHLTSFAPLLDLLVTLASEGSVTVVISVPNDAFWSLHNPYHLTTWGGDAFEEFRSLLPTGHVVALQHPVAGSSVVRLDDGASKDHYETRLEVERNRTPSQYLAAFGPGVGRLAGNASIVQVDLDEQRSWERQRESDLEFFRQRASDLESE